MYRAIQGMSERIAASAAVPSVQIDESNNAPEFFRTRGALRRTMAYLRNLLDRWEAGNGQGTAGAPRDPLDR